MKHIPFLVCTLLFVQTLSAQVISYDMIERNANTDVRLTLKDTKTSDPISWASVYLIPAGDTTITHFSLSDDRGDVLLKDVPVGKYELNAEMIGYNPHKKVYTIKAHWEAYDLGIIKMDENPEYLDAASISAIGNPVVVKKDTIEFNASSFRVGENAMLEDLLKKMPGMAVGEGLTQYVSDAINNIYDIVNRSGVQMLIFLAGLQSISPAIYESVQIDGATACRRSNPGFLPCTGVQNRESVILM